MAVAVLADHLLDGRKAGLDPVAVPGVDRLLVLVHAVAEILQDPQVVERVDVAGHRLGDRPDAGARHGIGRQQRRIGVDLVEILDDGERLGEDVAAVELQRRHQPCGLRAR
jgi:hypothetical protein